MSRPPLSYRVLAWRAILCTLAAFWGAVTVAAAMWWLA